MTWLAYTCIDPPTRREHLIYTVADLTFSIFYHTVTNISETLFIEMTILRSNKLNFKNLHKQLSLGIFPPC